MSEALVIAHPGRLLWEVLARQHRELSQNFHIADGELHVIVTERAAKCIWHWVSTQISDSGRVELPLVAEVDVSGVGHEPGVSWHNQPLARRPFQVPIAPWIVIHPYWGQDNSLLARAFPAVLAMEDRHYLCAWISPYDRELYKKGKTYQDQPEDIRLPNRLREFPQEIIAKLKE